MSIPLLTSSYVFGINPNVQSNAFFYDEATVAYPAGHELVLYNFEKKTQKILHLPLDGDDTSCLAANLQDSLLAVGSKSLGESSAAVHIFDVATGKRKRLLKTNDGVKEFVSVAISVDGKYVYAQGGTPDWNVYIWGFEKGKLMHASKMTSGHLELRKMSVNLFDTASTQICVTGVNLFRVFRFQDGFCKLIHQMKSDTEIRTHSWTSETRIVCGTVDSKILVFEEGELISEWQYLPTIDPKATFEIPPKPPAVSSIAGFAGGLFVGFESGVIVYYEKTEEHPYYKKKREESFEDSEVTHIAWNAREDKAVVSFKSNQVYLFQIETDQKGEQVKYDRLSHSFHIGPITTIDACVSKPLVATCGADRSIRIWNYVDNNLETINYFDETPTCMAIHPNGLYILAGFPSGLRLMAVLLDETKTFWEYNIRSARGCKFSNGGQYFAVITSINVSIFNTWTFETVGVLKVNNARVKGVVWSEDDTQLMTYCNDGSVQQWNGFKFGKISETTFAHTDSDVVGGVLNP
ncbi:Cilia- and flagella-associated protein 57, partial [Kappamyces sp. JEL0680]